MFNPPLRILFMILPRVLKRTQITTYRGIFSTKLIPLLVTPPCPMSRYWIYSWHINYQNLSQTTWISANQLFRKSVRVGRIIDNPLVMSVGDLCIRFGRRLSRLQDPKTAPGLDWHIRMDWSFTNLLSSSPTSPHWPWQDSFTVTVTSAVVLFPTRSLWHCRCFSVTLAQVLPREC